MKIFSIFSIFTYVEKIQGISFIVIVIIIITIIITLILLLKRKTRYNVAIWKKKPASADTEGPPTSTLEIRVEFLEDGSGCQ